MKYRKTSIASLTILLVMALILSACGRKGELYLPNEENNVKTGLTTDSKKKALNKPISK